jgi:hypothetical protein
VINIDERKNMVILVWLDEEYIIIVVIVIAKLTTTPTLVCIPRLMNMPRQLS